MFGYRSLGFGAFPNRDTTYTIANSALFNDDDSDFDDEGDDFEYDEDEDWEDDDTIDGEYNEEEK